MTITATEKSGLQATVQTLTDQVNALPDVNPLQAELDSTKVALAAANVTIAVLQNKIATALTALGS